MMKPAPWPALFILGSFSFSASVAAAEWGRNATLTPGWDRITWAAKRAATSTETWGPLAGALVLQIGHADEHLQSWAAQHTPLFGSQQDADRASDNLKRAASVLWLASALATPGSDTAGQWMLDKAQGIAVQEGAGMLLRSTVGVLKDGTHRTRPNGLGATSFPSDHASQTSFYATLASRNIGSMGWSDKTKTLARFGLSTLTSVTAWARVEANQHYPSDVLAGIALGHFFGAFFTDAFLGIDDPERLMVQFEPLRNGFQMNVRFAI